MGAEPGNTTGYLDPYRAAVRRHGPGFDALLWHSPESQERRFEALTSMVDFRGRSVADFGCGRGDLLAWLAVKNAMPARYVGVDALPEMIALCRGKSGCGEERPPASAFAKVQYVLADFARDADLFDRLVRERRIDTMVFSGSLNTFEQDAAVRVLERAWRAVSAMPGGTLVFNFLSARHADRGTSYPTHRFDPTMLVGWALARTPTVALRHDYLGDHDATIAMRVASASDLELPG